MANDKANGPGDASKRGTASMDDEKQREMASEGRKATEGTSKSDPERASEAGKKGGEASQSGQSSSKGSSEGSDRGRPGDVKSGSGSRS